MSSLVNGRCMRYIGKSHLLAHILVNGSICSSVSQDFEPVHEIYSIRILKEPSKPQISLRIRAVRSEPLLIV